MFLRIYLYSLNVFQSEKRQVPTLLKKTLAVDAYLTNEFVQLIEKFLPLRQLKVHYRLLEVRLSISSAIFIRRALITSVHCSPML